MMGAKTASQHNDVEVLIYETFSQVSTYLTLTRYTSHSSVHMSDIHPVYSCGTYRSPIKSGRATDTDFVGMGEVTFPPAW